MNIRFLLLIFTFIIPLQLAAMETTFFNVGQGNSTVVTCPGKPTTLIDAGSSVLPTDSETGKKIQIETVHSIASFIIEKTPIKQAAIIASHGDKDHYIWIPKIAEKLLHHGFSLKFLFGGNELDYKVELSAALNPLQKPAKLKNALVTFNKQYPGKIEAYYISGIKEPVLGDHHKYLPSYCSILKADPLAKDNDRSIVIRIAHGNDSALLLGDATQKILNPIMSENPEHLTSGVLVASHHGAETHGATTPQLLKTVDPKTIIFSAGMHGAYGHPALSVVQMACEHLNTKPLIIPHTFAYRGSEEPDYYPKKNSELDQEKKFKPVILYDNGWKVCVTTYSMFNTFTQGAITCYDGGSVDVNKEHSVHSDFKLAALNAPRPGYFHMIRALEFSNLNIDSRNLCNGLKKLPSQLTYLNLRSNKIDLEGIAHILGLINTHTSKLLIKLEDNESLDIKKLDTLAVHHQNTWEKNKLLVSYTRTESATKNSLDTLIASPLQLCALVTPCKHLRLPIDYYNDWKKNNKEIHSNDAKILHNPDNCTVVVSNKNELTVWDAKEYCDQKETYKPSKKLISAVLDLELSVDGSHILVDTNKGIIVINKSNNQDKLVPMHLVPNTLVNHPDKTIKKSGKLITSLNLGYKILPSTMSPITKNNEYIAGIDKTNNLIKVFCIKNIPTQIYQINTQNTFGTSVNTIENLYFTDYDETLRVEYKDKTINEIAHRVRT